MIYADFLGGWLSAFGRYAMRAPAISYAGAFLARAQGRASIGGVARRKVVGDEARSISCGVAQCSRFVFPM